MINTNYSNNSINLNNNIDNQENQASSSSSSTSSELPLQAEVIIPHVPLIKPRKSKKSVKRQALPEQVLQDRLYGLSQRTNLAMHDSLSPAKIMCTKKVPYLEGKYTGEMIKNLSTGQNVPHGKATWIRRTKNVREIARKIT